MGKTRIKDESSKEWSKYEKFCLGKRIKQVIIETF